MALMNRELLQQGAPGASSEAGLHSVGSATILLAQIWENWGLPSTSAGSELDFDEETSESCLCTSMQVFLNPTSQLLWCSCVLQSEQ